MGRNSTDLGEADATDRMCKEIKGGSRKLMMLIMKQSLRSAQTNRDVIYETFLVKSDLSEAKEISVQTTAYSSQRKEQGKNHKLGPPHVWAWGVLLHALVGRGDSVGMATAKSLKEHKTWLEDMPLSEKCELVRCCRVDKTFHASIARITFVVNHDGLRNAAAKAFNETGAEHKFGRAPASQLEREFQKFLEAIHES